MTWNRYVPARGNVTIIVLAALVAFALVGVESIASFAREANDPGDAGAATQRPAPIEASSSSAPVESAATPPAPSREAALRPRARVGRVLAIVCFLALSVSGVAVFYRFAVEYPANLRRRVWPGAYATL